MAQGQVITPSLDGSGAVTPNKQADGSSTLTWAVSTEHEYHNNGTLFLQVKTGGTPGTMTIHTFAPTNRGLRYPDRIITLTANATKLYGPFPVDLHNNDDGNIEIEFSVVTDLEVTAFNLPLTF